MKKSSKSSIEHIMGFYEYACSILFKIQHNLSYFLEKNKNLVFLCLGIMLLCHGLTDFVDAAARDGATTTTGGVGGRDGVGGGGGARDGAGGGVAFDATYINEAWCELYKFMEGSFGAILTIVAGIGAIVMSAIGQYKSGLTLIVVAVGSFIMRTYVAFWFGGPSNCDPPAVGGGGAGGGGANPVDGGPVIPD